MPPDIPTPDAATRECCNTGVSPWAPQTAVRVPPDGSIMVPWPSQLLEVALQLEGCQVSAPALPTFKSSGLEHPSMPV